MSFIHTLYRRHSSKVPDIRTGVACVFFALTSLPVFALTPDSAKAPKSNHPSATSGTTPRLEITSPKISSIEVDRKVSVEMEVGA